MRYLRIGSPAILSILGVLCFSDGNTFADPDNSKLTRSDRNYLDSLFREFLFDPAGAERVRAKVPDRRFGAWSDSNLSSRDGWLVKGTRGEPDRVFFTDGFGIPAPRADRIERIDFLEPIKRFFSAHQPPEVDTGEWVKKTAKEVLGGTDLFLQYAAWRYRLGHDDYAAQALGLARALTPHDPKDDLREALSRVAFDEVHNAFRARADVEAMARGEYFLRVFIGDDTHRSHAKAIIADLQRRRAKGVFGKIPNKDWPPGFSKWALTKKLDYLIDALDNAAEWQFDNPGVLRNRVVTSFGDPPFTDDRIVAALIELGEPAIPALIEVIEKDTRLTRWPVRQYKRGDTGQFHDVADAAEVAVKSILRVKRFPEVVMEAQAPSIPDLRAVAIRSYWEKYGKLSFDMRMMTILTEVDGSEDSWREAAENLARLDYERRFGVSDRWTRRRPPSDPRKPNPYVPKFTNPTVAEAIVAAMDRDRARQQGRGPQNGAFHEWPRTEQEYLDYLVELGDRRIGPELDHRAANAEDNDVRRRHAFAAYRLGASNAWKAFAKDVEMGTIPLPHNSTSIWDIEPLATEDVGRMVAVLAQSRSPEGDRALFALSDPKHRYYAAVFDGLVVRARFGDVHFPWRSHRYCLPVLRRGLDDATPTDGRYAIVDDQVQGRGNGWSYSSSGIPSELQDPKSRREKAEARLCDIAAMSLGEIVAGIPFCHVLQADPEQAIRRIKEFLDLYRDRFREMSPEEQERFGIRFMRNAYIPDIKALGRPATAHDLKAGTAVFELGGKGQIADGDQSGWLLLKSEARKEYPDVGLVVQCEVGSDGKRVYGVIFRHSIRSVVADEVERIEPYLTKKDFLNYRFTFFGFAR